MHAYVAELLGTTLLVLLGNGVVANVCLLETKGNAAGWVAITTGWGLAVFVAVACVDSFSGAHINPAVTVGLACAGKFPWSDAPGYMIGQLLGGILGGALVYLFYRDHFAASHDPDAKLGAFATAPAIRNPVNNLTSEIIGTAVLVLAVLLAVPPSIELGGSAIESTDQPTAQLGLGTIGALPIGLVVFAIGISLGGTTGYAINPARDLGPRIAHAILPVPGKRDSDWSYAWIPILGPLLGALAAVGLVGATAN